MIRAEYINAELPADTLIEIDHHHSILCMIIILRTWLPFFFFYISFNSEYQTTLNLEEKKTNLLPLQIHHIYKMAQIEAHQHTYTDMLSLKMKRRVHTRVRN